MGGITMKRWAYGILAACWLASCSLLTAETYYVATSGVDTRTGTGDWTNAVLTISNGVRLASSVAGNVVWVSNGEYVISAQINITNGITVRGWGANRADMVVDGSNVTYCFSINHANALLAGLTVMRGTNSGGGGGIYVSPNGGTISNCVVKDCIAGTGGGVHLNGNGRLTCSAILGNKTTVGNSGMTGGGVYLNGHNNVVSNCMIASNDTTLGTSGGGGGLAFSSGTNCLLTDSTIHSNVVQGYGGGIVVYNSLNFTVNRCVISNNFTTTAAYGGGIYVWPGSTGVIENCMIVNNSIPLGQGGGAYIGVGVIWMRNCLIKGNSPRNHNLRYGGGLYLEKGARVDSCTVVGNTNTYSGHGGGIWANTNDVTIVNSVVWSNEGGDIAVSSGTLTLTNCCVSNATVFGGPGNITNNPVFVDPGADNWRLSKGSPCINAGLNQPWMIGAVDLDGHSRMDHFRRQADIGAYEYLAGGTIIITH